MDEIKQQSKPLAAFTQHEDGGFEPTSEFLETVREFPEDFPDIVRQLSVMTNGRYTDEQIQGMIDNRPALYDIGQAKMDLTQGGIEAVGELVGHIAPDTGQAIRDFGESLDPKFEAEKHLVESIVETTGQLAPSIAAGAVTGGLGGVALAAGVTTLTFDDQENLANYLNEYFPEYTPDILVVQDDDDQLEATAKHYTSNFILDGTILGTGKVVGKLLKGLSSGDTRLIREGLEEASEFIADAQVGKLIDDGATEVEEIVVRDAAQATPARAEAAKVSEETLDDALRAATRSAHEAKLLRLANEAVPAFEPEGLLPVPRDYAEAFLGKVSKRMRMFEARTSKITDFEPLSAAARLQIAEHANQVLQAQYSGQLQLTMRLLKQGPKLQGKQPASALNSMGVYSTILTRAVLEAADANFEAVVRSLRANPDQKTRGALGRIATDYLNEVQEIWDYYRNLGTSASHQLLARKGTKLADVSDDFLKAVDEFDLDVERMGILLRDSKSTFVAKKIVAFDEAGIDAANFMEGIYKLFDEFEAASAGKIANLQQTAKLTPIEKLGSIGKTVQMVKDLQSTMLLGQFMTAGTEVISTGFNTFLMPALRVAGGGSSRRYVREMAGLWNATALARNNSWRSFKAGKDLSDDFFFKEGSFSRILDHETMTLPQSLMWRLFTFAVDTAQASTAFFKTARAYGIAYADGLEAALAAGMPKGKATKAAKDFAAKRFDGTGAIIDEDLRIEASQAAFQQHFDGSTLTGRLGQFIENRRNSQFLSGVEGLVWRSAMPFFRTLANIGSHSGQMIMPPGMGFAVRRLFPEGTGIAKFVDDFTGKNGEAARHIAVGRNRLGMSLTLGALALTQMPGVELSGPSRLRQWSAKKRSFEEMPPSSLKIGNTSVDLTRFLPFSAPLLLAGTLRDYQLSDALRMEGGEYDPENTPLEHLGRYIGGWAITNATLLQDAGAARSVFGLFDAVIAAAQEGDVGPFKRYAQQYASQFTPGPVKMANKAAGGIEHEGYTFLERWRATAGFETGYERLDFFGNPIQYPALKGVDPSNRRVLHSDDPAYAEFALLNRTEGLHLVLPRPDGVFTKAFWDQLGIDTTDFLGIRSTPSLHHMETRSGENAWDVYRDIVYNGRALENVQASTARFGDRVSVGHTEVREGETFEQAMRRIIQAPDYQAMSLDARVKVWNATFSIFKNAAKDFLETQVILDPELFVRSRYGTPTEQPQPIGETQKAAKDLASSVQRSAGSRLDAAFAIED